MILGAAVGVIWSVYCLRLDGNYSTSAGQKTAMLALFAVVGVFFGWMICVLLQDIVVPTKEVTQINVELAAIRTNDGARSNFVFGTGSSRSARYYRVYVRNIDGSVTPMEINAGVEVRIKEDPNLTSQGYWTQVLAVTDRDSLWFSCFGLGSKEKVVLNLLQVPVGSVVEGFDLN